MAWSQKGGPPLRPSPLPAPPFPPAAVLLLLSAVAETPPQRGEKGGLLKEQIAQRPLTPFFFLQAPPPSLDSPQFPW